MREELQGKVTGFSEYNKLIHIDKLEPIGDDDIECLKELRAVLEKYGKLSRFGVNLLHKHFDLEEGEIILEATDEVTRTQTLTPVQAAAYPAHELMKTNFSLVNGDALTSCHVACWNKDGTHTPRHTTFSD